MSSVRALLLAVEPVGPDALGGDVYDRFKAEQDTLIVPVIDEEGRPVGIIERNAFFLRMAAEFGRALYARRPIHLVMDPNPLVVEADAPIADFMGRMLTERPSDLLRGFILAEDGRYIGVGTALGLMQHAHQHAQLTMRQIEKLAHYDPLTGLPNRALFQKQFADALARAARSGEGAAVLCIDLDHFKSVNDTLGHNHGDLLLGMAAQRLQRCVREGDTAARLGGDEFAVVQNGLASPDGAARLATRIVTAMAEPFDVEGHQVVVGASVGIAIFGTDGSDAEELLKKADMALYRVKREGRGGFHFFEPGMDENLQARRRLELDLRRALQAGEFEVHYQPLYDLAAERITGCEALVRWRHPDRGMIAPVEFIPLAEETGLINPLGEWVLRQACADAATWPSDVRVAVNISAVQFRNPNFVSSVVSALANASLPAERLEVEITEGVLLQDSAYNLELLHKLRDLGVRISMDDFGTSYSSLSYLRSFPFDKIKIDQSFVRDLPRDAEALAIIQAVTGLGASLGIATTAEGVETQDQMDKLREYGCSEIQGYLISRPTPAPKLLEMFGVAAMGEAAPAIEMPSLLAPPVAIGSRSRRAA